MSHVLTGGSSVSLVRVVLEVVCSSAPTMISSIPRYMNNGIFTAEATYRACKKHYITYYSDNHY